MFYVLMTIFGAMMGSFLCCQVRRMQARAEGAKKIPARSICEKCRRQLRWYENVPIVSWLVLRGKCRTCGAKIGRAEILSEVLAAGTFLILALMTLRPGMNLADITAMGWGVFATELLFLSTLIFLAIYDGIFGVLPVFALVLAGFLSVIKIILAGEINILALFSVVVLGGVYLLLYVVSHGKWVGDGDYILAAAIGACLAQPFYALVALFVANFVACVTMYPMVRKNKNRQIYMGPFLAVGYVVAAFLMNYGIINL